jgi:6-phosphogluconolactonase
LDKIVKIFSSPLELAEKFAEELVQMIRNSVKLKRSFTIALSGGSTPELLYSLLSEKYFEPVLWQSVHFFWGDERCVSPANQDSNFGAANDRFLSKIEIPSANIHRIRGEDDPVKEALRYSEEMSLFTAKRNGMPSFDLILLGLGADGHTASIFPGHLDFFNSFNLCEVAVHPSTSQKRITVTGKVINNADALIFLVSGKQKADVLKKLFKKDPLALNYPAYYVVPVHGSISWFIDKEAASLI